MSRPPIEPIRSVEADHPWLWWAYVAAVAVTVLVSCAYPMGLAS